MQKWEYKLVNYIKDGGWTWKDGVTAPDGMTLGDKLNQLGDEGWEYIEVRDTDEYTKLYLFKRAKE